MAVDSLGMASTPDVRNYRYHSKQIDSPKEYTKELLQLLPQWVSLRPGMTILDAGCGYGANLLHFAQAFTDIQFLGVDQKPENIRNARELAPHPRISYQVADIYNLSADEFTVQGVMCLQTLSWMSDYRKALENLLALEPEWVLITSLFYPGLVEADIQIHEYGSEEMEQPEKSCSYNVYSIPRIERLAAACGYELARAEPFHIPLDLAPPQTGLMGTYTRRLEDGQRLQLSGPLLMSWYTLLLRRKETV